MKLLIFILALVGCEEKDDTQADSLGTISCKIDGTTWVSDSIFSAANTGPALTATAKKDDGSTIFINVQPHTEEGTYTVSTEDAHLISYDGNQTEDSSDVYTTANAPLAGEAVEGSITVEILDDEGMSGLFYANIYNGLGEKVQLTECSFDLLFTL